MDDQSSKDEISRLLKVLQALKQASHDLQFQTTPKSPDSNSPAIKALLELQTESDTFLSKDPHLSTLSDHLSRLRFLIDNLHKSRGYSLRSFLARRVSTHSITRVAGSIESEIQAWIDRESMESLISAIKTENQNELWSLLTQFEERISQGFNRELQDLVLKSKVLLLLERMISDSNYSKKIREQCGLVVAGLISFNKDVFVGQLLMAPLIHGLVSISSPKSMEVLCNLIRQIKSPLVDEIESNGEIPKIISYLDCKDLPLRVTAMDCILEIGYFGRKEAVEAMLKEGIVKKLVELQRSEVGGDLIEMGRFEGENLLERQPFASCVARFAVQLEVGEGLRQREKRPFKLEILSPVREASASDAEAATIVAEVLWGSSP